MVKKLTIDDLARMVKRGFDETASRGGSEALGRRVDDGFNRMEAGFSTVAREIELIHGDIREPKLTRDLVSRAVALALKKGRPRKVTRMFHPF